MGLKQDIVISNQFGSKSPGRYIMRYTSRTDANESLDINEYITKYTTRYSAVEQLKYNAPTEIDRILYRYKFKRYNPRWNRLYYDKTPIKNKPST